MKRNISPSPTPNITYVPEENPVVLSGVRKVAIFPFADYSHQQEYMGIDSWGGNIKVLEEITDHLVAHGLSVTVQEDVNTLLVDQDIIRPIDKEKYLMYGTFEDEDQEHKKIGTPEYELATFEHSPAMAKEIMQIIKREKRKKQPSLSKSPTLQGSTVGLTREKVVEIAQILGVDLVIRGRIIDYGFKDIGTMNPLYRGFVPVVIDSVKDLLFGTTGSYGYEDDLEDIESILMGSAIGYAIGNNIIDSSTSRSSHSTSGIISRRVTKRHTSHDDRALEGAGIGAVAGWMASQHPKKAKRSAVVQVRIYAQDGETGDVLWSNRSEIEYTPKSNFAYSETHPKVMFDKVVKESIKILMDNFFSEVQNVFTEKQQEEASIIEKEGA
jgi:hypothetical protein